MGLTHIDVTIRNPRSPGRTYSQRFLVDTGAFDSLVPADAAELLGLHPLGVVDCKLADGTPLRCPFATAEIEFLGEITAGRVLIGPSGVEPILGVTALESIGIIIDPRTQTLKRLPAIPLKRVRRTATQLVCRFVNRAALESSTSQQRA